jgi:hypothetical protein
MKIKLNLIIFKKFSVPFMSTILLIYCTMKDMSIIF